MPSKIQTKRTLLSQFRLSLLDRSDDHVTNTSIRESVEVGAESIRLDDEEGFGSAVVSAIDNCANWETECQTEFVTGCADYEPLAVSTLDLYATDIGGKSSGKRTALCRHLNFCCLGR